MVSDHHLFFLILSLTLLPSISSDLASDRAALLRLQAAVRGHTLLWSLSNPTPCSWGGVTCDNTSTARVIALRLPGKGLRGELPLNSIGNLTGLRELSLRGNALSGQLPSDLASCTLLEEIHLQGNDFSGEIPRSFFKLRNLLRVNLARNRFSGNLLGFNDLINLRTLYLENNQFTGSLPDLSGLNQLKRLNVSFNRLTGFVPSSLGTFPFHAFLGTSLCGGPLISCSSNNGSKLSGGAIAGISVGSFVLFVLIVFIIFISWKRYKSQKVLPVRENRNQNPVVLTEQDNMRFRTKKKSSGRDKLVFFGEDVQAFTLSELLMSSAEVIGKGVVGSTYKAYLESGVEVIVKRLKNVCVSEEVFRAKIEEVGSLIHENLEPLRGYFYGIDEKLLVYEPIPKGSLFHLLHSDHNGSNNGGPSWKIMARIAHGTASAIEYLHSISPETTHGNIKSSNIFITNYYEARVSEHGLMQLVSLVFNFNGYRAPEVVDSSNVSQKSDVYSFGVVLLEMLTSKEPDSVLTEEGIELPKWVQSVVEENGRIQVFDPNLVGCESSSVEEEMGQMLHVALDCASHHPERRPSMVEVTRRIQKICAYL